MLKVEAYYDMNERPSTTENGGFPESLLSRSYLILLNIIAQPESSPEKPLLV